MTTLIVSLASNVKYSLLDYEFIKLSNSLLDQLNLCERSILIAIEPFMQITEELGKLLLQRLLHFQKLLIGQHVRISSF